MVYDFQLLGSNAQNNPATGNPVAMPATNLNIGMDLWNAPSAGPGMIKMRSNQSGVSPSPGMGREWIQVVLVSIICSIFKNK